MTVSTLGKFSNSLKFEPRGSGAKVAFSPVYGPAGFLAFRDLGNLKLSADGVTWTDYTWNYGPLADVTYLKVVNNQYMIIGESTIANGTLKSRISVSSDGINWTHKDLIVAGSNNISGVRDVIYANGFYLMVNGTNQIFKSTDLVNWTQANSTTQQNGYILNCLISYVGYAGTIYFIAAGTNANGYPATARSSGTATTWSNTLISASSNAIKGAVNAMDANSTRVVAVANNGNIWTYDIVNGYWLGHTYGTANYTDIKHVGNIWTAFSLTNIVQGDAAIFFNTVTQTTPPTTLGTGYNQTENPTHDQLAYGAGVYIFRSQKSTDGINWTGFDYQLPNQQPYLDYSDARNWNDWQTIDFWTYLEISPSTTAFQLLPIASQVDGVDGPVSASFWQIYFESQNNTRTLFVQMGDINEIYSAQITTIPVNSWFHTRVVIRNGVGAVYINGQRQASNNYYILDDVVISQNFGSFTFPVTHLALSGGSLNIGRIRTGFESDYARPSAYWLDEFMVNSESLNDPTNSTIPVPTKAWNNTENTMLLLHFDENYLDDNSAPFTLSGDLTSVSSIVTNANSYRLHDVSPAMNSTSSMTVLGGLIKEAAAHFDTTTAELTTATRAVFELANFNIDSSINTLINRTREFQVPVTSTSTLTPVTRAIKVSAVSLAASSGLTAEASDTLDGISLETTTSSMTIIVDRVKFAQAVLEAVTELTANTVEIDNGLINSTTTSTMNCTANVAYSAEADLQVIADMVTITNGVLAHVDLTTTSSLRATCRVTLLDLGINYMIPADNRTYRINTETRTGIIEYEDRTDLIGRL